MKKIKNKLYVCKMHILRIYDRFETQIRSIALAIGIVAVIVIAVYQSITCSYSIS